MKREKALVALAAMAFPFGAAEAASAAAGPASASEAADVVAREVAAYNAHDAALVAKLHAPEAAITLLPSGQTLAKGTAAIVALFTRNFKAQSDVKLTLRRQSVLKNMVVNHYAVTNGASGNELVAIYDVKNGLIANEWLIIG